MKNWLPWLLAVSLIAVVASGAIYTMGSTLFLTGAFTHTSLVKQGVLNTQTFTAGSGTGSYVAEELRPTINATTSGRGAGLVIDPITFTVTGGTPWLLDMGTTTTDYVTGYTQRVAFSTTTRLQGTGVAALMVASADTETPDPQDGGIPATQYGLELVINQLDAGFLNESSLPLRIDNGNSQEFAAMTIHGDWGGAANGGANRKSLQYISTFTANANVLRENTAIPDSSWGSVIWVNYSNSTDGTNGGAATYDLVVTDGTSVCTAQLQCHTGGTPPFPSTATFAGNCNYAGNTALTISTANVANCLVAPNVKSATVFYNNVAWQ